MLKNKTLLAAAGVVVAAGVLAAAAAFHHRPPSTSVGVAAASTPPCTTTSLRPGAIRTGAASGVTYYTVPLVNSSSSPCDLAGYPPLRLLAGSSPLPTSVRDGIAALSERQAPNPVVLSPRATASFTVAFSDDPGDAKDCPAASSLLVGVHGGNLTLRVPLGPCHGVLQTTPFLAGDAQPH